jgi:hypothetical protein
MNNQSVLLLIAIGVLIVVLVVVPSSENFGSTQPYTHPSLTASESDVHAESSVDCKLFPKDPACKALPPVTPVDTGVQSCAPSDGQWSTTANGPGGRSSLNSPCCQPPKYELGTEQEYKTCDDKLDPTNKNEACVANCCANADNEANKYDASWYPMARCACSLWCYNQNVPHFSKFGTAVHYITGDIAEAQTGDKSDFIGSGGAFSGQ